jgi:hypothetical protein
LELKRRKKKEPLAMPPVWPGETAGLASVKGIDRMYLEADVYPPIFTMVQLQPAGKLVGIDRDVVREQKIRIWFRNIAKPNQRIAENISIRQVFDHAAFARMLVKIGYCFAVAERGVDGFDGSDVRQLLCGERDDIYNFVGGSVGGERLTDRYLHHLAFRQRGDFCTVIVHLFSSYGAPPYEVVVGPA